MAIALVLGVGLTACSSSSNDEKKTGALATSTSAPVTAPGVTYTGDKNSDFCRLGAEFSNRFSNLNASLSGGPDKARTEMAALKGVIEQAKSAAPTAVKADVDTLATAFDQFFTQVSAANFDPQAVAGAGSKLVNSNVQTAAQHLQAYAEQVCGLATSGSNP
ncbi:MAG TPA: hypothetical protein VF711_07395 [Acidimicrobiales bacterium]|jgi:hypothetical protein